MKLSVIISTYNHPKWLQKVLWGFESQSFKSFEIVIADDGSGEDTREVIESFLKNSDLEIQHIWHEDNGYQKCQILNKAIVASKNEYLLFTDGDCIPRTDFIQHHKDHAEKGFFLSGGAIRLPLSTSRLISEEDIKTGRAFKKDWLISNGLEKRFLKNLKLTESDGLGKFLNKVTPANSSWNGGNASGWKQDILAVNGMDERMEYGGQDRELGERLYNYGLKSKQLRYSAICLHLEHGRGYKSEESVNKNQAIRKETRMRKKTWTEFGIKKESK